MKKGASSTWCTPVSRHIYNQCLPLISTGMDTKCPGIMVFFFFGFYYYFFCGVRIGLVLSMDLNLAEDFLKSCTNACVPGVVLSFARFRFWSNYFSIAVL
jgi:hypothetical protein